ncbi:hypothetical protein AB0E12_06730 [Micromonospora chersina]|uniref:hypothetical protein n=1 Tax=Micromonospora chersina TaxID=47854 RepID=UPI00340E5E3B
MEELATYCPRAGGPGRGAAGGRPGVGAGEESAGWAMVGTGRADAESPRPFADQLRRMPAETAETALEALAHRWSQQAPLPGKAKQRRHHAVRADDRGMWERVEVPAVGGPVDGRSLLVSVNDTGLPPESIGQEWLWVEYGGELLDADVDGVYELEPVAGAGPPWVYIWAPARR